MIGAIRISDVLEMESSDSGYMERVKDVLASKRQQDTYPEVLESVSRCGVQNPILIRYETLCNGHHRIAACVDLGITEILFTDDPEIGWANEFEWPEECESSTCSECFCNVGHKMDCGAGRRAAWSEEKEVMGCD